MFWFFAVAVVATLAPPADKLRTKLETVGKGLAAIKSPALEDLLKPMLDEVHTALKGTDADCKRVLAEFPKWQKQMSERQGQIAGADDNERTSLLVAVLQNKADLPVSEQLAVVNAPDFDGLPVVKYIDEHHDEKTACVTLALQFLDGKAAPAPKKDSLEAIEAQLQGQAAKAEAKLAVLHASEQKIKKLFSKINATKPEMKFLKHREERKVQKEIAVEQQSKNALDQAVVDIKKHDIKGLMEAQKALKQSMAAYTENAGQFVHLLQTTTPGFSCPYCGAQCLEKCRTLEHKNMGDCLKECVALNPVGPSK